MGQNKCLERDSEMSLEVGRLAAYLAINFYGRNFMDCYHENKQFCIDYNANNELGFEISEVSNQALEKTIEELKNIPNRGYYIQIHSPSGYIQ